MARQVLPWVGAAVGFMIGGPAGAQWGFAIGGIVGNAVDPQVIQGPKLGEGQDNTASEGGFRPIVLGKGAVGVCMIHEGPLKKRTIRHRQSKGGGPVTEEERAYRTMAFALGESAYPETGVQLLRLWIDNKLRYDVTPTSQIVAESTAFADEFTFYPGNETQQPDPDIEAFMGAGNVPSYRGGAPYIVFPDWDVTDSRGMAPMIKAELVTSSEPRNRLIAFRDGTGIGAAVRYLQIDEHWGGSWQQATTGTASTYSIDMPGGRVLTYGSGGNPAYTDNAGDSWASSTGESVGGAGGAKDGDFGAGSILIPGGVMSLNAGIRRSIDYGESFQNMGHNSFNAIAYISGLNRWIGHSYSAVRRSDNAGSTWFPSTWSAAQQTGIAGSKELCSCGSETFAYFGGADSSLLPRLVRTSDAVSVVAENLPNIGEDAISCVYERGGVIIAGTRNGVILYKVDNAWGVADYSDNVRWNDVTHNGYEFVIIGSGDAGGDGVIASSVDGISWTVRRRQTVGFGESWNAISQVFGSAIENPLSLSTIVAWAHERVGVPAPKFDVTALTDDVEGVVFGDGYTASDAIRTLMALYFFDAGEFDSGSGYRINYIKRGGAAFATLTESDIVEGPEDWEREDSYERPRVLHVAYQNPVADYGAPNIAIKRTSPDVLVTGERSLSVPVVFSNVDEITQRADVMMTVAYTEIAGTYEIALPDTWLELAPTMTIGFSIRGKVRRLRMTEWRYVDGVIKSKWMADRQSAYTSNLTGLPVVPTTPPPPSIVGPTVSVVLDIPALVDSMDSLHMLVAASGQTPAWYGSVHQIKPPFEIDFMTAAVFNGITTIMGLLQDDVTAASQHYTDTTNVVRVTLYSDDELQTYTQQQFLAENGAFALAYDDGGIRRWEILQYRDAVKVGDKEWRLTTLARGRLNTEATAHPAGSIFVLLDSGLRTIPAQTAWLGEDIDHRAVSNGQLPDQATPYTETYTGESQREFPVAHLFGEIDGDDLILSCVPRHRFGTDDHPVQSINHDGYAWTATDGSNSADATTAGPSHTFDVTGWTTPITISVAQLNRITGAGPTVTEVIE